MNPLDTLIRDTLKGSTLAMDEASAAMAAAVKEIHTLRHTVEVLEATIALLEAKLKRERRQMPDNVRSLFTVPKG